MIQITETKYKAGFTYYDKRDHKCTLISWEYGRWNTMFEFMGVCAMGFTDDCWIDLYTDKAFYNARTMQIVYYDEVDIIPKVR